MKLNIVALLLSTYTLSNMNPNIGFAPFKNYYFVETGTFAGQGIRYALKANCFKEIHSVEISEQFALAARRNFRNLKNVFIINGDSGKILWDVISKMDKPITFWLDGHNGTPAPNGESNTPLLQELDQIKKHPIKTHTIIIDDMHCCGTALFDYLTKEDIISKIKEINTNYIISYIAGGDNGEYPNNIMIAQVE